jgi:precorrin-2 dehydrogenase/sirohydrochlorin ferrochelatase
VSGIPLFVDVSRLHVLVAGGGGVASRKVKQFAAAHAQIRIVAPELSDECERLVLEYAIQVERRPYRRDDIADAQLVFAATSDKDTNQAIAKDAEELGRLVNVTDDAQGGMFSVMAMHKRGPLTIAVNAGGVPTAALRIRDAIARQFDARYGDALDELVALRRELLAAGKADKWKQAMEQLVGEDFCELVEDGRLMERIAQWR